MDTSTANLFENDPELQGAALDAIAPLMLVLVSSPEWLIYKDLVDRTRHAHAFRIATSPMQPLEFAAMEAAHLRGYLAGLKDAIDSAENLVKRAQAINRAKEEQEEEGPGRRRMTQVSGRGGV